MNETPRAATGGHSALQAALLTGQSTPALAHPARGVPPVARKSRNTGVPRRQRRKYACSRPSQGVASFSRRPEVVFESNKWGEEAELHLPPATSSSLRTGTPFGHYHPHHDAPKSLVEMVPLRTPPKGEKKWRATGNDAQERAEKLRPRACCPGNPAPRLHPKCVSSAEVPGAGMAHTGREVAARSRSGAGRKRPAFIYSARKCA